MKALGIYRDVFPEGCVYEGHSSSPCTLCSLSRLNSPEFNYLASPAFRKLPRGNVHSRRLPASDGKRAVAIQTTSHEARHGVSFLEEWKLVAVPCVLLDEILGSGTRFEFLEFIRRRGRTTAEGVAILHELHALDRGMHTLPLRIGDRVHLDQHVRVAARVGLAVRLGERRLVHVDDQRPGLVLRRDVEDPFVALVLVAALRDA